MNVQTVPALLRRGDRREDPQGRHEGHQGLPSLPRQRPDREPLVTQPQLTCAQTGAARSTGACLAGSSGSCGYCAAGAS